MRNSIRFAVLAGLALPAASISQGALVGHWTFDEASSGVATTVQDSTANNNDGTVNGGATYVAGQIGTGALSFDGTDDFVQVVYPHAGVHPLDMAGSQYTVAWWANVDTYNGTGSLNVMISTDDGQDSEDGVVVFYYAGTGYLTVGQNAADGTMQNFSTGYYMPLDQWVHMAITYDDATDTRKLYANGNVVATDTATTKNAGSNQSTDLYFGRFSINNSHYFNGALDDVRIYDDALTIGQINDIMNNVPEPSMIGLVGLGLVAVRRRHCRLP